MLKKIICSSIILGVAALFLLLGEVPVTSANGLVFRNIAPANAPAIAPNAVTPPSVLFPDGLSLGSWNTTIRRVSWGRVGTGGTTVNAGSGDWNNVFENGMGIFNFITFNPAFTSEPVCTITPDGQTPVGISYGLSCGTGFSCVSVWQSSAGSTFFDQGFNFICVQ